MRKKLQLILLLIERRKIISFSKYQINNRQKCVFGCFVMPLTLKIDGDYTPTFSSHTTLATIAASRDDAGNKRLEMRINKHDKQGRRDDVHLFINIRRHTDILDLSSAFVRRMIHGVAPAEFEFLRSSDESRGKYGGKYCKR